VLAVPTGAGFRFAYGPGSFARHRGEARACGLPARIVRDDRLAWDVDLPADLAWPTVDPGAGPRPLDHEAPPNEHRRVPDGREAWA
jgi:hypothetical protein